MRTLPAALVVALAVSACTSAESSEPVMRPTSVETSSPDASSTTSDPVVFEAVLGDPLLASLEQSRQLIFDYSHRFPDDFLDERSNCVSQAFLEVLGAETLVELGLEPPMATVLFDQLDAESAAEISTAIAECEATLPIVRGILRVGLHPQTGGCVANEIVNTSMEPDLIRQLASEPDVTATDLVAELADSCRAEQIDRFDPPLGGENRRSAVDVIWSSYRPSAPTSEFETLCRSRFLMSRLEADWVDRYIEFSANDVTVASMLAFLRNEATEEEVSDISRLVGDGVLSCGSIVSWLSFQYELDLTPDELRCLATQSSGTNLVDYLSNPPDRLEVRRAVGALLDRCGA